MSTRSSIAIKNENGTVNAVYCHFDGYPSGVGAMLLKHYNTEKKARNLINLGSLSFIEKKASPPKGKHHSFDHPLKDVTVAYHRDRGDEYDVDNYASEEHWLSATKDSLMEYFYIFKNGKWYVDGNELTEEMCKKD